ncbi:MAG: protein translocase subunit SecF [Ilumatobacteraceae bacterium]
MTTDISATPSPASPLHDDGLPPRRSAVGRLYHGETSIDFYGRRWWGLGLSGVLVLVTIISLLVTGLNLGIDFEGGVSWEVPSATMTVDQARGVLEEQGIPTDNVKIVERTSSTGRNLLITAADQPLDKQQAVRAALASSAGIEETAVSSSSVSSTWGASITTKAVRALIVFLVLVALFIAWRFEWRMAISAIAAMLHDVLISVGVYSVFGFEVTPATVVAFLTILGFSLYDTIVVFDKVKDNDARYASSRVPYADIMNVSMNQTLMRSLNTSIAAVLPVLSLLIVGAGILGAVTLREFSLALLVGLITGSYSSIFVATPLLAILKERMPKYRGLRGSHATGADLERLVLGAAPVGRDRRARRVRSGASDGGSATIEPDAGGGHGDVTAPIVPAGPKPALTHPPRPRKKKRR